MSQHHRLPPDVRRELFIQHRRIRELVATAEGLASAQVGSATTVPELAPCISELRDVLERHAVFEEAALEPVLATADVFGPENRLLKHHKTQHLDLLRGLEVVYARSVSPTDAALDLLDSLLAVLVHMDAEEVESKEPGGVEK